MFRTSEMLVGTFAIAALVSCGGGGSSNASKSNRPPAFLTAAPATSTVGVPYTYAPAVKDLDGDSVSLSLLASSQEGGTFVNGLFSWTPTAAQAGQACTFTVQANDGKGGSVNQSWSVVPNGSAMNQNDLAGDWQLYVLTSGDAPQWRGWARAFQSIDGVGYGVEVSYLNSDGSTSTHNRTWSVASDGTLNLGNDLHAVLSLDKNLIVGTTTDGGGGYSLLVMARRGGSTFSAGDLIGSWQLHLLVTGDAPQWIGWARADFVANESGNIVETNYLNSSGSSGIRRWTWSISADGTVNLGGDAHAVMSLNKNLIFGTMTDGGGGYDLFVMSRRWGTPFSAANLAGTWQLHVLTSGDAPQWLGWARAVLVSDGSGQVVEVDYLNSSGSMTLHNRTWRMNSDGSVDLGGDSRAVKSLHTTQIIGTMTDGGGGYNLFVMTKR
jgi:hypothetical protein